VLGKEQAWTFAVYLPVLLLCFGLALVLEKLHRPLCPPKGLRRGRRQARIDNSIIN
jgi:hypothetical protein